MSGQTIVNKAKKHLGENGRETCKWYPLPWGSHWCCAFLDKLFFECKAQKKLFNGKKVAYVPTLQIWMKTHYPKVAIKDAKPGDIVVFTWTGKGYNSEQGPRDHIGVIREEGTANTIYTIEGNTGGTYPTNSTVKERTRSARYVYGIYRPPYKRKKVKKAQTKKSKKTEAIKTTTKWKKGFDVSYAQPGLTKSDFMKAKEAGWGFVIIRIGTVLKGKLYKDKEFESKYNAAKAAGLKVGVYFYSMAKTVAAAKKEAEYTIKELKGRKLQMPVFIDFEDQTQVKLGKDLSTKICEKFCQIVEKAGYQAGVYANYTFLSSKMNPISSKYYVWLAQYPKATLKSRYEMHQYSSATPVPGIGKAIDVNKSKIPYGNYPK